MIRNLYRLTLLLCATAPTYAADRFEFQGIARDLDGDTVLYQEMHRVSGICTEGSFRPLAHDVEYQNESNSNSFANKTLNYEGSPIRPSLDFQQPDFNEQLQITYPEPTSLEILWQPPEDKRKVFTVSFDEGLVVDAGFDHFVRTHWQAVTAGESVEFRFLAPTRGDHYGFVLEPAPKSKLNADIVVQIRPTSLVLRFLVDPIILGYNQNGALTHYKGLTNIRADSETNFSAHIRYEVTRYPACDLTS
ncbi:hypothetical protein [Marinobacter sp. SS5-14b]|uniref:hypothetical protein n=1 Tax=Marinobacter sp. SS5-14b TaxID=3050456 RepID=UPI0026DF6267|nr:hypothetical protein [Marinobacter sp. SS5-14b]